MPITTKKLWIWTPVHGKVYLIQHYVMKFVSDLRQIGDFLHCHDITEILLIVALNTIDQTKPAFYSGFGLDRFSLCLISGSPRKIYLAIGDKVIRMDPSGGDQEDVLQTQADDLDFDIRRNLMFWIDKKEKKVTKQNHKDVKLEKKR